MLIIAILVGAAVGAAFGRDFGFVTGALLGWLIVRSIDQGRAIVALNKALAQRPHEAPAQPPVRAAATADEPDAFWTAGDAAADAPAVATPVATPPATPAATPAVAPPAPPPAPRPDLLAPLKHWLFGGNTIVKAGVGILFIGLAFLAKFATEHANFPVELRLAAIGAVALVPLVVGWRLRLARPGYAQVLQGGAVAVLYLTLFVAFRFYGVLAVGPVFGLMAAVAALSAALAVLQDARALAVVGALGGFAAPLLVSTGGGDPAALFGYYLVLDLGIAAVAWHRHWRELNLIGFVATFGVAGAWGALKYEPERYAMSQAFLIAYFIVFVAIGLLPARRTVPAGSANGAAWVQGSLLFGLPTVAFALQYGLVRDMPYGAAFSALALGAFYVVLATLLRGRLQPSPGPASAGRRSDEPNSRARIQTGGLQEAGLEKARLEKMGLEEIGLEKGGLRNSGIALSFDASLAIAAVFLTLVIPFALDARSTAGAWALEGAGLVWLGFRQPRRLARGFGYALLVLAGVSMGIALQRHGAPAQIANPVLFNAALAGAASILAAWFVHRHATGTERLAEPALIAWALLWLVGAAALHIDAFVAPRLAGAAWLGVASVLALLCTGLAVRLDWRGIALVAAGHAPVLALVVLQHVAFDPVLAAPWHDGGAWAWPLAFATHLAVLARAAPRWPAAAQTPALQTATRVLGVAVLAALGALQGRALTAGWGDLESAWPWLGWMALPALLLLLLPRPRAALVWPVRDAPGAYQGWAAGLLATAALVWSVLANIASDGSAVPLPHVPLVNPLDLAIGIALFGAWRWLCSPGALPLLGPRGVSGHWALAAAVFVWLNAIVVRGFHHLAGVPYRVAAWSQSLAVQTGITLLWSAIALVLMWLAARRAARGPWLAGAALLVAVVVKLMLVDLAGTGSVTRIVSFIGVGALMLVIGYVAPPPPREGAHALA